MPRAGRNPRLMGLKRRLQALYAFGGAIVIVACPFFLSSFLSSLHLTSLHLSLGPFYIIWLGFALLPFVAGLEYWQQANRADRGAKGEEDVAQILQSLQKQGWRIEYGLKIRGLGDVDVFLLSPRHRAYSIDVKSHKGEVLFDGQHLNRRLRSGSQPFEKDFLQQAVRQATTLKEQKGLQFVTPLLVFSRAIVAPQKLYGVHVLGKNELLGYLQMLDN